MAIETREATVSRIKWEKAGNDWKLLQMSDGMTWKGNVGGAVTPGMFLRAEGNVITDEKWGKQFEVTKVLSEVVLNCNGNEAWIIFRLPEVGEARAKEMVAKWGDDLWHVIQTNPQALTSINGITDKRAKEISEVYAEHGHERQPVAFLIDHGLDVSLAFRAAKHFRNRGGIQGVLDTDPYDLMDVDGIKFDPIDAVAQRMGIGKKDPRRVCAWARAQLEAEKKNGHCFMAARSLFTALSKWGFTFEQSRSILFASPRLTVRKDTVMLRSIDHCERMVATKALELLAAGRIELTEEPELPEWLDPSQREAALGLLTGHLSVLTGGPGTGKTTTLKAALDAIEARGERLLLAAPTGKAAKRFSQVVERPASTIHRLVGWTPDGWKHHATEPLEADVVVIDEASMVDIELCSALFEAIGRGTRLILVGDVDQLPPVGPGQPLHNLIHSGVLPVYSLTKTHRQQGDSWVIDNAKRIINGECPKLDNTADFEFGACATSEAIVEAVIALYRVCPDLQVLTPEHKKGAGTRLLNVEVQKAINPRGKFDLYIEAGGYRLYEGDKVLYTKNKPELPGGGLVNGDMGVVRKVFTHEDRVHVAVEFDGRENEEHPEGLWELSGGEAAPLTLSYAMTVHKSQGSEWAMVVIVADNAHWSLRRQLLYTGVTRTNDKLTILGSADAVEAAAKKPRDTNRRTLLLDRIVANNAEVQS